MVDRESSYLSGTQLLGTLGIKILPSHVVQRATWLNFSAPVLGHSLCDLKTMQFSTSIDFGVHVAVNFDGLADRGGIGTEPPLPQAIAENGGAGAVGLLLFSR